MSELEPEVLEGELEEPLDVDELARSVRVLVLTYVLLRPANAHRFAELVSRLGAACEALLSEAARHPAE